MRKYATQMEAAKQGIITPEMKTIAEKEFTDPEIIRERVALGQIAIPANINHKSLCAEGIGKGLRTKINVNLGISGDANNYEAEMDKVRMALRFGAEAIMDLSNYGKTNTFRQQLIALSPAMIGTVPMYDAIGYLEKDLLDITAQDFLKVVRAHAEEGVDFMTIHAGINRRAVEAFKRDKRKMNIVSRGGSLLFAWMEMTGQENPFYEYYDAVLDILREYDVTISLGDALRPGCLDDSTDAGQIAELIELGALAQRAWDRDVQVMIEGPGHMAMDEIAANMRLEKRLCHEAPFYVLGPLVTDIFPGYDHITSAIGGAIAAANGADFLCYVTRPNIFVCQMSLMSRRGSLPPVLLPMLPTLPKGSHTPETWTIRWRRPATGWIGMPCSKSRLIPIRHDPILRAHRLQTATPAQCVEKCVLFVPPT